MMCFGGDENGKDFFDGKDDDRCEGVEVGDWELLCEITVVSLTVLVVSTLVFVALAISFPSSLSFPIRTLLDGSSSSPAEVLEPLTNPPLHELEDLVPAAVSTTAFSAGYSSFPGTSTWF